MGDYSWCSLRADDRDGRVSQILKNHGLEPEGAETTEWRYPNGEKGDPDTTFIFEEIKSGLDGLQLAMADLRIQGIPYTATDDGCPGVWGEEETVFVMDPVPYEGSRLLLDGAPILTIGQWMKVKDLDNAAELIAGHLSQDVTKWITY